MYENEQNRVVCFKMITFLFVSGDHTQVIEFEEIKLVILYDFQSFQNGGYFKLYTILHYNSFHLLIQADNNLYLC